MHKHHIMPRQLGGTNDPDNLVEVTVEEHAKIHHSLWILGGRWEDELAYRTLSGLISREEAQRTVARMNGKRIGPTNKGKKYKKRNPNPPQTDEHIRKRVASRKANGQPYVSEKTRQACIASRLGWRKKK